MDNQRQYPHSLLDERKDPVGLICLGLGHRFSGSACPHYARGTGECELLLERGIAGVYEFGRCLNETELLVRLHRVLEGFGFDHEGFQIHEFLFGTLEQDDSHSYKGLLQRRLSENNIVVLYEYVNKSLYAYTKRILRMRRLITDRRRCGSCKHLPPSSPRICQLREIHGLENSRFGLLRLAHESVCEGYEPLRTFFDQADTVGCTADREDGMNDGTHQVVAEPWDEKCFAQLDVHSILNLMMKCRNNAPMSKRREIETRRLEDVNFLYGCLLREKSLEEAKTLLLNQKAGTPKEREAVRRRLDRDLEAVGSCLSQPKSCH
jgi:hypothetical protein